MTLSAAQYLRQREWIMGNGQCDDCCGLSPDWFHPPLGRHTPEEIGHLDDCPLAIALGDVGEEVVMKGSYLPEEHGKWMMSVTEKGGYIASGMRRKDEDD